jgi:hypothetical protein
MRILIAGKYGPHGHQKIGGVQTWIATLAAELERRHHVVELWEHGQRLPEGRFDIGVLSNWKHTGKLAKQCNTVRVVCHGIIPDEKPLNRDVYFTSEGVRDHWHGRGPILRQPIDLKFWTPSLCEKEYYVRFSYRRGLAFLPKVAVALNLPFYHLQNATPHQARSVLQRAACVAATGRAALEAMAVGAPVVILDHRSAYQGPLLDVHTLASMARNYSGRGGTAPTIDSAVQASRRAIACGSLRHHVEQYHDVEKIAGELLP